MERRDFLAACTATCALSLASDPALATTAVARRYTRARLNDEFGNPFKLQQVAALTNYLFHYPYGGTPCFLIDLGKPSDQSVTLKMQDGTEYLWQGGVGPRKSVVAFSAICSHRLSFPTKQHSFISFRHDSVAAAKRGDVIACCHEGSIYDPAQGARVLAGPAPQPLAAVLLEHDATTDALYAVGTLGGELFDAFFRKYEVRLELEYGGKARATRAVGAGTQLTTLDRFCKNQVRC